MLVGYIHGKYVKPCFILIVHLEQLGLLVIYSTLTHMGNLHANHTLWEFKIPTSNYIAAKCINHVDYLQVHDCHHETCRLPLWYWRGLPSGWLDPIFLVFLNPKSCRTYIYRTMNSRFQSHQSAKLTFQENWSQKWCFLWFMWAITFKEP